MDNWGTPADDTMGGFGGPTKHSAECVLYTKENVCSLSNGAPFWWQLLFRHIPVVDC